MRRRIFVMSFLLTVLGTALIWAQNSEPPAGQATQSSVDYFAKTISINKVYPTKYGYVVAYADSKLQYQELYLPMSWFNKAGGMGQIFYGSEKSYPYMNIFWRDGKFDHIALFLFPNYSDPSWGMLPDSPGLASKFNAESDTLDLKY